MNNVTTRTLLGRGYFPAELPNPFRTSSFANFAAQNRQKLPAAFRVKAFSKNNPVARCCKYSHARSGLFRRRLSIPNPVLHYLLCRDLLIRRTEVVDATRGTSLSATAPVGRSYGRAISGRSPLSERSLLAARSRQNQRYLLQTDISRFYHSIYTHSIPWALDTKATAKANRYSRNLGNCIDYWVRQGQDGQTIGIPIGPDTSLVIAEILMQKCDRELETFDGPIRGFRYIDDYELAFRTRSEAEDAFHVVEQRLADLELALNPRKTLVIELPHHLNSKWVHALAKFEFRPKQKEQERDLIEYFDLATEFHKSSPDSSVLKYAASRLRSVRIHPKNWTLAEQLLLLCVPPEPASLPHVLRVLIEAKNRGAPLSISSLGQILNELVIEHAPLDHSSEVAWALWACLSLEIKLVQQAVDAVEGCNDSVVGILALDLANNGLVESPLTPYRWEPLMTTESLYEEHWLLAYEANIKGWLPSIGADHVYADPAFRAMKDANVAFYKSPFVASRRPGQRVPVPLISYGSMETMASYGQN